MNKMSKKFEQAYSAKGYDVVTAVRMYDQVIENEPDNYAAWNNRGVCKIEIGIAEKNPDMFIQGKADLQKAIELAAVIIGKYPMAELNLDWVDELID